MARQAISRAMVAQITLKILQVINALCAAPVMGRQKHGGFGLMVASKSRRERLFQNR
jgi:hypothetical protein